MIIGEGYTPIFLLLHKETVQLKNWEGKMGQEQKNITIFLLIKQKLSVSFRWIFGKNVHPNYQLWQNWCIKKFGTQLDTLDRSFFYWEIIIEHSLGTHGTHILILQGN